MNTHNMKNMDEAAKLFTGLPEVFCDLVDFALRKTGFKVVRGSLKERNTESIACLSGMRKWYKKVSNDVVAELEVTNGEETATLLVALENQTSTSCAMTGRNLMSTAVRWDGWRRKMKHEHSERKELKTHQELLDGVLSNDRMTPVLMLVVHFGQEPWTGLSKFTDTLDCPEALKPMMVECPSNVISFYNLSEEEINEIPEGPLRVVAKCIRYAKNPEKLKQESETDPSFCVKLDEMRDIIVISTGLDMEVAKQQKGMNMKETISAFEQYYVSKGESIGEVKGRAEGEAKGRAEGEANIVQKFIRNRRNRHISDSQILEDLKSEFELDETKARQYMEVGLANA